jgi:hypothetical protein
MKKTNAFRELFVIAAQLDEPVLQTVVGAVKALVAPTGIVVVGVHRPEQRGVVFSVEAPNPKEAQRLIERILDGGEPILLGPGAEFLPAAGLTAEELVRLAASLSELPDMPRAVWKT